MKHSISPPNGWPNGGSQYETIWGVSQRDNQVLGLVAALAKFSYNSTTHTSTKMSPFKVVNGREPPDIIRVQHDGQYTVGDMIGKSLYALFQLDAT